MRPITRLRTSIENIQDQGIHLWRTSTQVRVVSSVVLASASVILILGIVLISIIAQQLLGAKLDASDQEIERARRVVEQQIANTDALNSTESRLAVARQVLTDQSRSSGGTSGAAENFEPVLIAPDVSNHASVSLPQQNPIPDTLRKFVQSGQVSYQYATVARPDGTAYKALIIGTPTSTDIPNLELYLVVSMQSEESMLDLVRGLLLAGGLVLMVLLVAIAWLFSHQITAPIRSASRIAERFASGNFRERMPVEGEDEIARLGISFNEMAESLSQQITQLEEYTDLQRQFTSDVSHELRTPLTTVRMAADMIWDNADELDPLTQRSAELLITELDRFEMLLGDLLEISRHDAGVADLTAERIDIRGCVTSAWHPLEHLREESGVQLIWDFPEEPVSAVVDTRRVERILRNLLANALDHSEGNPIMVALRADDEEVAVTVTDNGVGLKPGQEELVFNRFWRADPSRERRTGGTGLGLAIAREDALLHGGRLEAVGDPGVGSCFRLTLPLVPGGIVDSSPLPLVVTTLTETASGEVKPVDKPETGEYSLGELVMDPLVKRLQDTYPDPETGKES
ncbi:MtrAB system histidine kinase MtrB [Corynebacterium ulceribovis]|uniref:MtrAB system histidine kinase MtrB n=1 Tax=Corynebacterium ulceribovis TaxID=487732 RepID=UPI00035E1ADA|nr:MtrAB system histidine kinase MtrB [Corynebacterium ulceribovis]